MSIENRLVPSQDAGVESEFIGFDYGLILQPGESIQSATGVTCVVSVGIDPSPSSRLSGGTSLQLSQKTGVASGMVVTRFGGALSGVTYQLQCVVMTTLMQSLSIITYISGVTAP
jgi:hypothetical protein